MLYDTAATLQCQSTVSESLDMVPCSGTSEVVVVVAHSTMLRWCCWWHHHHRLQVQGLARSGQAGAVWHQCSVSELAFVEFRRSVDVLDVRLDGAGGEHESQCGQHNGVEHSYDCEHICPAYAALPKVVLPRRRSAEMPHFCRAETQRVDADCGPKKTACQYLQPAGNVEHSRWPRAKEQQHGHHGQ